VFLSSAKDFPSILDDQFSSIDWRYLMVTVLWLLFRVRILIRRTAILAESFCEFPQCFHAVRGSTLQQNACSSYRFRSLVDVYYVSETLTGRYHQGDDPEVCHLYLQPFNGPIRNVALYGGSFCIESVHPGLAQTSGHTDKN
jgi:hypothetical protein